VEQACYESGVEERERERERVTVWFIVYPFSSDDD